MIGMPDMYALEHSDEKAMLTVNGGEAYSELLDDKRLSWWISIFSKVSPLQKNILVDDTNLNLFKQIYSEMEGKTLVAVVNQWHMPGIEAMWRHSTNTEIPQEPINPIGDMPINEIQDGALVNTMMTRHYAKIRNSEAAGDYDYILHYHLVAQEWERHRHCVFDSYKDPSLEHSLYRDENENVPSLPYNYHDAHHH